MIDSQALLAFEPAWCICDTRYCDSTTRLLLYRLWLEILSPVQDGSADIPDIFVKREEVEKRHPSLFISVFRPLSPNEHLNEGTCGEQNLIWKLS